MAEKRFYIGNGENYTICDSGKGGSDFFNMLTQYEAVDRLNELFDENEQLKHNNKMLSMKMSEVYAKYRLLYEFSEDTNPNDAVKRVLSELMQITKEYR